MVQGGDPEGTGKGGNSIWGKAFKDEFRPQYSHTGRGVVAMASADAWAVRRHAGGLQAEREEGGTDGAVRFEPLPARRYRVASGADRRHLRGDRVFIKRALFDGERTPSQILRVDMQQAHVHAAVGGLAHAPRDERVRLVRAPRAVRRQGVGGHGEA